MAGGGGEGEGGRWGVSSKSISTPRRNCFLGDWALQIAPGTRLPSSSVLTICMCVVPNEAASHREVTPNPYGSTGRHLLSVVGGNKQPVP